MPQKDLAIQLNLIGRWVAERARSPHTARSYKLNAERLVIQLSHSSRTLLTCTDSDVTNYLIGLLRPPNQLSLSSLEQSRRVLFAFFEWTVRTSLRTTNPLWTAPTATEIYDAELGPPPKSESKVLTPAVISLLTPSRRHAIVWNEKYLRLAVIANLSFWAGARTNEILAMKISDLDLSSNPPRIFLPRQGLNVSVEIPTSVADLIESYLTRIHAAKTTRASASARLIRRLSRHDSGGSRSSLSQYTYSRTKAKSTGELGDQLPRITFRAIRRSFADVAVDGGVQELVLAEHRRHANVVFTPPEKISSFAIRKMFKEVRQRIQKMAEL